MPKIKKRQHRKKPKFKRFYKKSLRDDFGLSKEKLLQKIHVLLAQEVFGKMPDNISGDWVIKTGGINLYIDSEMAPQAEIEGTSEMPLINRVKIHVRFLKMIRKGCSICKAVEKCLLIYQTQ